MVNPMPRLNSVTAFFGVRFGEINFPESDPRAPGAHFLEHMLFRGTANRTAEQIEAELGKLSTNNAFTESEHTSYFIRCARSDIGHTVELLSDLVRNPNIAQRDINMEFVPILNEYLEDLEDPHIGVAREFFANMFPGHNASTLQRLHDETDIRRVSRDMLMDIYRGQYTPDNSALVLYGAVSARDGLRLAQEYFGGMKGTHVDLDLIPASMDINGCSVTVDMPTSNGQAYVVMGLPMPHFRVESDERERAALKILSDILSARLLTELRTRRGLVYDIEAGLKGGRNACYLSINTMVDTEDIDEVTSVIRDKVDALAKCDITGNDVSSNALKHSKESMIERDDTLLSAENISCYAVAYEHPLFIQNYPEIVMSLTLEDVKDVAAKYLDMAKLVSVVGVPEQ